MGQLCLTVHLPHAQVVQCHLMPEVIVDRLLLQINIGPAELFLQGYCGSSKVQVSIKQLVTQCLSFLVDHIGLEEQKVLHASQLSISIRVCEIDAHEHRHSLVLVALDAMGESLWMTVL